MKLAILALAVVGAAAQQPMATQFQAQPMATQFQAPMTTQFQTAAPLAQQNQWFFPQQQQFQWPTTGATLAPQTFAPQQNWFPQQQQQYNPWLQQPVAPTVPTAKRAADFSEAVRDCVNTKDSWCEGNNWDSKCTEVAEGRECQAAKGTTVSELEYITVCIRRTGKKYQTENNDGPEEGDTWCSRRLEQWDSMCTMSEEGCAEYVRDLKEKTDATDDEKTIINNMSRNCIQKRDSWCQNWEDDEANEVNQWDDLCREIESTCNSPPADAAVRTSAPVQPQLPMQYFQPQYQMQYMTGANNFFPAAPQQPSA